MQNLTILLFALAMLALASTRSKNNTQPGRFQHLKGWQKIFGVLAIIIALIIILNPDFLALGLFGDAAFFDMLVLALSAQMLMLVAGALRSSAGVFRRVVRWLGIPSPGLRYVLSALTPIFACVVITFVTIQKAVQRLIS